MTPGKPALAPVPDLASAVRRLAKAAALVIGDVMLDRYVYGSVSRVSPEAPVPILREDREIAIPGGAGNVVRNLTALGAATAFISVVGDDQAGSDLTGLIGGQPNVEPWLLVEGGRTTTVKTRYIAAGQHLFRADREQTHSVDARLADRILRIARDSVAATSVTVLSDFGKGLFADGLPEQLVATVKAAGRRVVVDAKGPNYAPFAGADVIMPNRAELAAATGIGTGDEAGIVAAATALRQRHGFGAVLTTRGVDGMVLVNDAGVLHIPAEAAEVYDVSGAGDTAVAMLACALAAGLDLPLAARLANLAAGIAVGKAGTAVVRERDLLAALSPQRAVLRKVVDQDEAEEQVTRWRQRGWRVGFTFGAFDGLTPGDVHLLEQARLACDRLVVGLNSDPGARKARGQPHPEQQTAARAAVVASVPAVDLVCVFEDESPEALVRGLRPDVLVCGAYPAEAVLADLVHGWGGQVIEVERAAAPAAPVVRLKP
ncbi:MAG TPA: PfkB family carbohydrate kinase [Acetobacteraceae bacterium]|nr:PfkB family carbohydrate kinase [Acetobacteraceae bacterium]